MSDFHVVSADGTVLHGTVDRPAAPDGTAVIFASGSGLFDRDMRYGVSGTPRDLVFKDLGARMAARGLMAVRADRRGVTHVAGGPAAIDSTRTITATTSAQVEDMRALYDWVRDPGGLGARRVVFFAHSEGALHVGRLAASGAASPAAVIGVGALMESPKTVLHWQMAERNAESIAALDRDGDGITTNEDIRAGWEMTPAAASGLDALLSPTGRWTRGDLDALRAREHAAYEAARDAAFALPDNAPYPPGGDVVVGPNQWWRSWFADDTPNAANLAGWNARLFLHYGTIDSQTNAVRAEAAARAAVPASLLNLRVHEGVGHALGPHPAIGPMAEPLADLIADQAASA